MRGVRSRRLWALVGAAVVGVAVGLAATWATSLWQQARALEQEALDLREAVSVTALLQEPDALESLRVRVAGLESGLDGLKLGGVARWLGWLPVVGDDLRTGELLVQTTRRGVAATQELLQAGVLLAGWSQSFQASGFLRGVTLPSDEMLEEVDAHLQRAMREAHQAQELLRSLDTQGLSASMAARRASLQEVAQELQATAAWGRQVLGLLTALGDVQGAGERLKLLLDVREAWSLDATVQGLEELQRALQEADRRAGQVLATLPGDGEAEASGGRIEGLQQALQAMEEATEAGLTALHGLAPALRTLEEAGYAPLGRGGALVRALKAVQEQSAALADAQARLADARDALANMSESIPEARGEAEALEGRLASLADLLNLVQGLPVDLLGERGPLRLLVLGHTADELRATGGYVSAVWEVTLDQGSVTDIRYLDAVEVDDWDNLASYPKAPWPLTVHMNAPLWLLRDISWEPDFLTTAQLAEDMYWLGQHREVDGVVAINQWTLQRLAQALGHVPSPATGEPVPAEHFLSFFEEEKTRYGRAYVDVTLRDVLDTLREPSSPATLWSLATALRDALESKEIMLYFNDAALQAQVKELGWAGQLATGPGDALLIVDSNVGWSKVDRNIVRGVRYEVTIPEAGPPQAGLTLIYRNRSGPEASSCRAQWMPEERGSTYEELKQACYWNFLRVYVPSGARLLNASSLPLPPGSVAEAIGVMAEGEETLRTEMALGRTVFSGLFTVGAGEVRRVTLGYELPPDVVEREGQRLTYRLHLQQQPGVREREVEVIIRPPEGYVLSDSTLTPAESGAMGTIFKLRHTRDMTLEVVFQAGRS